jgi:hypothetical protein
MYEVSSNRIRYGAGEILHGFEGMDGIELGEVTKGFPEGRRKVLQWGRSEAPDAGLETCTTTALPADRRRVVDGDPEKHGAILRAHAGISGTNFA